MIFALGEQVCFGFGRCHILGVKASIAGDKIKTYCASPFVYILVPAEIRPPESGAGKGARITIRRARLHLVVFPTVPLAQKEETASPLIAE